MYTQRLRLPLYVSEGVIFYIILNCASTGGNFSNSQSPLPLRPRCTPHALLTPPTRTCAHPPITTQPPTQPPPPLPLINILPQYLLNVQTPTPPVSNTRSHRSPRRSRLHRHPPHPQTTRRLPRSPTPTPSHPTFNLRPPARQSRPRFLVSHSPLPRCHRAFTSQSY